MRLIVFIRLIKIFSLAKNFNKAVFLSAFFKKFKKAFLNFLKKALLII
jgi:hypothetical protein